MLNLWTEVTAEPSLDEILEDPIVRLLMQGDSTGVNEVRALVEQVRDRLGLAAAPDAGAAQAPRAGAIRAA